MNSLSELIIAGIIVGVILLILSAPIVAYSTQAEVTVTVEKTERINTAKDSYYLIFTDKEVFKDTDTIWFLKFNSSDIYGKLKAGKTYKCKVNNWRVPLFSWYRNILSIEEVK